MRFRHVYPGLFCCALAFAACSSSTADTSDAALADGGAVDMRRDSSVPDLGALPASNGSCTGPHSPSDVLRCLQYPASIAEATVRSQCDTAGETFAVTCPTEDLFGACIYESQSWWFYEPASEEQRAQASGSCGGGTWVEY